MAGLARNASAPTPYTVTQLPYNTNIARNPKKENTIPKFNLIRLIQWTGGNRRTLKLLNAVEEITFEANGTTIVGISQPRTKKQNCTLKSYRNQKLSVEGVTCYANGYKTLH